MCPFLPAGARFPPGNPPGKHLVVHTHNFRTLLQRASHMTASTSSAPPPRLPGSAALVAAIWFVLAALAGATGLLVRAPFPLPQLTIVALVVLTISVATGRSRVRAWIDGLSLRALMAIHGVRFVGIVFLMLAARGELAQVFADRAGWGDIATAAVALALVGLGDPVTPGRRALIHVWNVFGFLDLLIAVGTATWVTLRGITPGVTPLLSLPLSVVPLFFVPILMAGHVIIYRRLVARGR
jgi:hypothetical protein